MQAQINETVSVGGLTLSETTTVNAENGVIQDVSVPAGKVGTLTTRTSDTVGIATLGASHGITTGMVVDLYWSGGAKRGVTVGTVSGLAVPLTASGTGDVLPAQDVAITVSARTAVPVVVTGDNAKLVALQTPASVRGSFAVLASDDSYPINQIQTGVYHWASGNGATNPLAGKTTETAYLSHDQTSAQKMQVAILSSN